MTIIQHHAGTGELEPLNFELAGVFALGDVLEKHGAEAVMAFMKTGHPTRTEFRPSLVMSVAPDLKAAGRNDVPFGVFMATKEANPQSTRPLQSRASLTAYRERYPVLSYDSAWQSWKDVVDRFRPT